ncbi:helix-turn-helix transcriptional regulator [Neisseria animaloris]|uniref:helix-turn-helix transcriptional regulator n=1 Tax=Neisseria animaloris TaxID=326522 RepID=UPI0039E0C9F8
MANAILRQHEVTKRLGISSSTLWYRLDPKNRRHDPDMPRPFKLSGSGNAIGWLESEIDEYIAKQAANRI